MVIKFFVTRGLAKQELFIEDVTNLLGEYEQASAGKLQYQVIAAKTDEEREEAKKAGLVLNGPYPALLVQGDDELGALAQVHERLYEAGVNVYASSGVADGHGSYGYIVYVRQDEYDQAAAALEV